MRFQSNVTVMGMKPSKGDFDGTSYDSTKVYVVVALDEKTGGKGSATQEYSMGKAEEYDKYKHLTFPFDATGDFEMVTSGKVMKTVLHGLKPVAVKA